MVPRDLAGTFSPALVPKHCRDVTGIESKILGMYSRDMSQRDIARTIEELYGFSVSHETVPQIGERVGEDLLKWQNRPLQPAYASVFVGYIFSCVRSGHGGNAAQQATCVILGIDLEGYKDVPALSVKPSESKSHWMNLFDSLRQRGVKDILFLSMDGAAGLEDGVKAVFTVTIVQR